MWTDSYFHVPFMQHGRTRNGVDCWGLVCLVFAEKLKISLPLLTDYKHIKDDESITEIIKKESENWAVVSLGEEKPFDVAIFKMMGVPTHVGLVVGENKVLHAEENKGVHVNNYKREQFWKRSLTGFYRHAKCSNIAFTV